MTYPKFLLKERRFSAGNLRLALHGSWTAQISTLQRRSSILPTQHTKLILIFLEKPKLLKTLQVMTPAPKISMDPAMSVFFLLSEPAEFSQCEKKLEA